MSAVTSNVVSSALAATPGAVVSCVGGGYFSASVEIAPESFVVTTTKGESVTVIVISVEADYLGDGTWSFTYPLGRNSLKSGESTTIIMPETLEAIYSSSMWPNTYFVGRSELYSGDCVLVVLPEAKPLGG
jgi:hypothetical protein